MTTKKTRFIKGIILAPDTIALDSIEGEIKVDSSDGKIKVYLKDNLNPSASREILTNSQTQTVTNKTIDFDNNIVSNIETDNLKSGVLNTSSTLASASDTQLPSALAVKTYIDNSVAGKDAANEISYSNATSGLSATNVQDAIDEVDGNVDNLVTLSGVALDATNLGSFTGTTIPDNQTNKQALQALETSHESHTGASQNVHGIGAGNSVVGTGTSQALTNKTIDADLNTVSNIDNADIKVGADIARSKLASGTANRVVVNDASGVQSDAAAITAARALISDANGIPTHSTVTSTELGYVSGVSSAIQTQINSKVNSSGGTLTNGSIVTPSRLDTKQDTYANLVTYATTASNGQLVFATDTKEMYQVVDGFLKSVGGGAGGINYIDNGEFENNTTGWSTYKDAAADSPADGTGGTANTTFTRTTSTPLRGNASGLITKSSGASRQGEGVSYDFTIDAADQAQILRISFDYNTEVSTTDYIDGNIRVYVYDVTNSRLIEVVDRDLYGSSFGKFVGTFQTSPDSVSYRLIFHITDTSTVTAYTIKIDNVIVGPQTIVKGAIVTDPELTTMSSFFKATTTDPFFGTVSADKLSYAREGKYLIIHGGILQTTAGTAGSGTYYVELPGGLFADGNFITNAGSNGNGTVGSATLRVTGVVYNGVAAIRPSSTSQIWFTFGNDTTATANLSSTFFPLTSADWRLSFTAKIPIQGWSSNVVLSEDAGNREIVFNATESIAQSIADNATSKIIFSSGITIRQDTASGFDLANSRYIIPETGYYDINARIYFPSTSVAERNVGTVLYKNGATLLSTRTRALNGNTATPNASEIGTYLLKGDYIEVYGFQNDVAGATSYSTSQVDFSISKRSSPQTIAASEVVHLSLQHDSGQVIPNATTTTLIYNSVIQDTHNAYNSTTGIWICPQSGYYQISATMQLISATGWTEGETLTIQFLYNNSVRFRGYLELYASSTTSVYTRPTTISGVVYISKGQNAYVQTIQNNDASVAMYSNGTYNTFTITKVG